jgi:hypothetical protein
LLVLDDLHWADVSSMHLLTFLAAQLATNRVAIVGTYRDTEVVAGHALHSLMQDAARRGQLLPVRGLDPDEVAALMASVASTATLRTELANAVHRQTAGNPLFVGEVTRLLAQQHALDRDEVSVGIPQGVREVIERRMVRLPQRCIELLTLGAVVGEEFRLDTVARAASIATPELVAQLEPAIAAGVAREASGEAYRFAHSLFREALYDGQGTIARAGLHLQIATALEQRHLQAHDVGAAELANHFGHAALTGETDKAVHYATIAGHEASSALAYSEAVHHFERALQVLDLAPHLTESDRAELLLDLSGARWRAGDRTGALAEVERAIFLARRTGRGDVLARAAVGMHRLGGVSGVENNERLLLLREAHDALGDEETPLRVRVLAALAKEQYHAWLHLPASIEGLELAEQAVAIARRLDNSGVLAEALAAYHDCLWFSGKERLRFEVATELEQVALVAGDREQAVEAVLLQSVALLELADHEALPRLEMFIQQAEALPNPRFAYLAATRRATVAMVRGDIPALERALEEAGEIGREHAEPDHINVFAAQVFCLKTFQRRRSESVAHAREAYLTNKAYRQLIDAAACLGLLDEGKPELARAKLETVDIDEISSRFRNYGWLYETAVVAEAAAALGDDARMATLSELLEPYAGTCIIVAGAVNFYGCAAQYLGLMARARGRAEEAAAYFATALDAYERLGATWWADQVRDLMSTASEGPAANQLRRDGSAWTLDFGGTPVTVRDAKGIRDLAVLLAAPGREVAAADLVARGEITAAGADAVLDERARREFGARLAELDGDLAEADAANDLDRIALIKTERDALAHELAAALGLGGRERKLGDPAERARKAVAARLRDAIERIAAEHPELGQHLRASVSTGTFCSYAPPSPTSWRVTDSTPR